ncbi:DUF4012 domain-containing protein [Microbacterium sp. G2-8]|uniref:DUF4012 domain-containing protein n=1 Tax=Microbacterium sp. G2-8 TaxID=2842454 RepID=UPI001C8A89D3|nr:DUF4012 domain-containing protein [Microbacterium sp. G2-8]
MTDQNDPFAGLTRKQLRDMRERLDAAEAASDDDPAADAATTALPVQGAETTILPAQSAADAPADAPTPALGTPAVAPEPGTASADPDEPTDGTGRRWTAKHTKRTIVIALIVLVVCTIWLGVRALIVKGDLEAAQRVIAHVQQDPDSMQASLPVLGDYAGSAASVRWDPVWRLAEFVPWAGDNLEGVRLAARSLDVAVNDLAVPALTEMDSDSEEPILQRLLPILTDVEPDITSLAADIERVAESDSLVGPVRAGVDQVNGVMQTAGPAIGVAPSLLGADEARNYLLVFMNNAESVGLGGSAASQTLINVDSGTFEITAQASSASYQEGVPVDVDVPQSALDLYSEYLVTHINTTASRPDFPTMAELTTSFWNRDVGDQDIDGVVAIDPIALSYILEATGPIQLATGETMTSDNAVQMLLSDVYTKWNAYEEPEVVDAFFASVADQVFQKIAAADFDMLTMMNAVTRGIDQGSVLFHSDDDEVQQHIADERVSGILPASNEDESTVGVYFRDESASKIDYYMKSNIDVAQTCRESGSDFQVDTTLHLDIDQGAADALPDYVKSGTWGSSQFRTAVYVYGPPGTTIESVQVEGRAVELKRDDVVDLDRPVAYFETYLAPSELATVTATFSGDGEFGPAALQATPMVNTTTGAVEGC